MNQAQATTTKQSTHLSLESAVERLPHDVPKSVFMTLVRFCRLGMNNLSRAELRRMVKFARLYQKLSAREQALLLSRRTEHQHTLELLSEPLTLTKQDEEAFIKEHVSSKYWWVQELRRMGVSMASRFLLGGRRSPAEPPRDWANDVLYHRYCEELPLQDGVEKFLDQHSNIFVQLPDRRWHIKYQGESIVPLPDKLSGLRCIHALIRNNHLGTQVFQERGGNPYGVFMPVSSAISQQHQRHQVALKREQGEVKAQGVKTFAAMRGNPTQEVGNDSHKLVDSRSNPEVERITRALKAIGEYNTRIAGVLNRAISHDQTGVLSFTTHETWVTDIPTLPYDAVLEKIPTGWRIEVPYSREPIEVPANRETGMGYVARILQLNGVAVPSGLMANGMLLKALMDRPPYQKLFKRASQPRVVRLNNRVEFDFGTRQIIEAVAAATGDRSRYFEITHLIARDSPLARYIPTGYISLTPEGLSGVLHLLQKSLASSTMSGARPVELVNLVRDVSRAIEYVKRYEGLAAEVETASIAAADKVQKAIAAAIDQLWAIGENSIAKYFDEHIKTGKLCSHNGPWLWDVRGIPTNFPDIIELAQDHIYMKKRKLTREEVGFREKKPQPNRTRVNVRFGYAAQPSL
jgi:hypothetical protein